MVERKEGREGVEVREIREMWEFGWGGRRLEGEFF
jgi:hypothetical protein